MTSPCPILSVPSPSSPTHCIYTIYISLIPRCSKIREECLVSTVRTCVARQVFQGNLETTVILVRVARPYITELPESLQSSVHSTIEQSYVVYPKVVKPGMCVFLCHYLHVQLTYLNELYGECNGTARACTKSGHQVLLSDFFECLGMRIIYYIHVSMYIHIHCIILPDVTYVHIHVSIWKTLLLTQSYGFWTLPR